MKYALAFGLFAFQCLVCIYLGWPSLGAWAALALYPALSFAVVAAAYLSGHAAVFGKRQGRLPHVTLLWGAPYLLVSYGVWWAWRTLTPEPTHHLIQDGLWLGRRPLAGELPEQVERVVDMTAEFSRAQGLRAGLTFLELPTLDGLPPKDVVAFDSLIRALIETPTPTYIHCAQGHGRSALVVLAVLLSADETLELDEAIKRLQGIRPGVSLGGVQRTFLTRWLTQHRA